MKNVFNGVMGFGTCMITLVATNPIPGLDEAIKAVISIVAGIIGSVVTYYLNKWFIKKSSK